MIPNYEYLKAIYSNVLLRSTSRNLFRWAGHTAGKCQGISKAQHQPIFPIFISSRFHIIATLSKSVQISNPRSYGYVSARP